MEGIEFTEDDIRIIWKRVFKADVPDELTTTQIYQACVIELSPEILREELRCLTNS